MYYIYFLFVTYFFTIVSHHCLVPIYYIDFYIRMYIYLHCTLVCKCECVVTLCISLTHLLNENDNMDSDTLEVIEHSPYYSDADFQSLLKLNNTLSIMSLNSQSINAKFDEVQLFIDRINTSGSLGILGLQESWTDINEDISLFELPGYTLHHQGKQCCKHGGLFV